MLILLARVVSHLVGDKPPTHVSKTRLVWRVPMPRQSDRRRLRSYSQASMDLHEGKTSPLSPVDDTARTLLMMSRGVCLTDSHILLSKSALPGRETQESGSDEDEALPLSRSHERNATPMASGTENGASEGKGSSIRKHTPAAKAHQKVHPKLPKMSAAAYASLGMQGQTFAVSDPEDTDVMDTDQISARSGEPHQPSTSSLAQEYDVKHSGKGRQLAPPPIQTSHRNQRGPASNGRASPAEASTVTMPMAFMHALPNPYSAQLAHPEMLYHRHLAAAAQMCTPLTPTTPMWMLSGAPIQHGYYGVGGYFGAPMMCVMPMPMMRATSGLVPSKGGSAGEGPTEENHLKDDEHSSPNMEPTRSGPVAELPEINNSEGAHQSPTSDPSVPCHSLNFDDETQRVIENATTKVPTHSGDNSKKSRKIVFRASSLSSKRRKTGRTAAGGIHYEEESRSCESSPLPPAEPKASQGAVSVSGNYTYVGSGSSAKETLKEQNNRMDVEIGNLGGNGVDEWLARAAEEDRRCA
ncbi:hypothetical protein BJ742DRAFT_344970 [Cladochytrium replicatum]|nr:hypothetical protein BJ742DRAFT_344970 [Cladochytrium replicatum]